MFLINEFYRVNKKKKKPIIKFLLANLKSKFMYILLRHTLLMIKAWVAKVKEFNSHRGGVGGGRYVKLTISSASINLQCKFVLASC